MPQDDAFPAHFAEEVRFAVSGPPPVPSAVLAAVLALAITYGGMLGKVYAEILESTDTAPARALL